MKILNKFKRQIKNNDEVITHELSYQGIPITINFNVSESNEHIIHDYHVLENNGIETLTKDQFIPWLLNDQFSDKDINKIIEGIEIYEINYHYGKIITKYSPTNKEDYFGQFEFCFNSCNDYTKDVFEAASMNIYIINNDIVKVSCFDI